MNFTASRAEPWHGEFEARSPRTATENNTQFQNLRFSYGETKGGLEPRRMWLHPSGASEVTVAMADRPRVGAIELQGWAHKELRDRTGVEHGIKPVAAQS